MSDREIYYSPCHSQMSSPWQLHIQIKNYTVRTSNDLFRQNAWEAGYEVIILQLRQIGQETTRLLSAPTVLK